LLNIKLSKRQTITLPVSFPLSSFLRFFFIYFHSPTFLKSFTELLHSYSRSDMVYCYQTKIGTRTLQYEGMCFLSTFHCRPYFLYKLVITFTYFLFKNKQINLMFDHSIGKPTQCTLLIFYLLKLIYNFLKHSYMFRSFDHQQGVFSSLLKSL